MQLKTLSPQGSKELLQNIRHDNELTHNHPFLFPIEIGEAVMLVHHHSDVLQESFEQRQVVTRWEESAYDRDLYTHPVLRR